MQNKFKLFIIFIITLNLFAEEIQNKKGLLTKRQERILEKIQENFGKMGLEDYDKDSLDGMGDYPIKMARDFILDRKGLLDEVLDSDVEWDFILLLPFRGSYNPGEHNFINSGLELITKIKEKKNNSKILLIQNWTAKYASIKEQNTTNENIDLLAKNVKLKALPWGDLISSQNNKSELLYKSKFTLNDQGIKLIIDDFMEKDYLQIFVKSKNFNAEDAKTRFKIRPLTDRDNL